MSALHPHERSRQRLREFLVRSSVLLLSAAMLSSCSFRNKANLHSIQIAVPRSAKSAHAAVQPRGGSATPTQLSDITCYAINITGSAIPSNPGVTCAPGGDSVGIVGGFISSTSSDGIIKIDNVPAGNIDIQLVGVATTSTVGCPVFADLLKNPDSSTFNGISSPLLLGSTSTTVTGNTAVTLTAAFDSNTRELFKTCGVGDQGPSFGPHDVFYGASSSGTSGAGPVYTLVNGTPTGTVSDLSGGTVYPSAYLSTLQLHDDNGSPPLSAGISFPFRTNPDSLPTSLSPGLRAVLQLQWDVTSLGLSGSQPKYPFGRIKLQIRGGQNDNCAISNLFGVTAGVWDHAAGQWLALGASNPSSGGQQQWSWADGAINVPLADLVVSVSGKDTIIARIESNYLGTAAAGCSSAVYVASASLDSAKTFAGEASHGDSQMRLSSTALSASGGGGGSQNYVVAAGTSTRFFVQGGTPPYTFTRSGTPNNSIGSVTGVYSAPNPGTETVTVTDASVPTPQTATSSVQIVSSGSTPVGLGAFTVAAPSNSDGSYNAGDCIQVDLRPIAFDGVTSTASGSLTYHSGGFFGQSDCTTPPPASISGSGATAYFLADHAGPNVLEVTANSLSTIPNGVGDLNIPVIAGAFSAATLFGPSVVNESISGNHCCVPYTLNSSDSFGNAVSPATAVSIAVSGLVPPTGTVFYSDAACTSSISSQTFTSGQASAIYLDTTVAPGNVSLSGPTAHVVPSGTLGFHFRTDSSPLDNPLTVVAAGVPVRFQLSVHSGSARDAVGCVALDLKTVDACGVPEAPGVQISPTGSFPSGMFYGSSDDCDSNTGGQTGIDCLFGTCGSGYNLSSVTFWIRAYQLSTVSVFGMGPSPISLLPSKYLLIP